MEEQKKTSSENLVKVTCVIQMKLPSLNEYIRAERTNRYMGANMKRSTQDGIAWFIRKLPKFEKPVFIHFHWVEKTSKRDLDNIAFAKKFILDALVENGKLKDDSQKYVKGFTDTFEKGKEYQAVVVIEEVNE